ncbi:MAG: beta strand repeat-containing protein [Deltaproteobacteria bacterium]
MRTPLKTLTGFFVAAGMLAACAGNQPPVITSVVATPATVAPGGTVSVAATATDADQDPLSYKWTAPTGWTVVGGTVNEPTLVLTAPAGFAQTGVVSVTVTDGRNGSATSQAVVATQPDQAPTFTTLTASPNPVAPGGVVSLVAVAQSASGAAITYKWSSSDPSWTIAGSGGSATLTAPAKYGASTSLTVVASDGTTQATGALVVTTSATASPVVKSVTATPPVVAPKGTIQLAAQATSPGGQPLTYHWSVADSTWTVAGTGATATLTAPAGYGASTTVSVAVTDAAGASASGAVAVATSPDATPIVSAIHWTPTSPSTNQPVTLSAIASTPIEGATFAWTLVSLPTGSKATLTGATTAAPSFTPDVAGKYVVGVILTDAAGSPSQLTTASLNVTAPAPTAIIAGTSPLSGAINTPLALDGSASSTPTGNALIFAWGVQSQPNGASTGFYTDATLSQSGNNVPKPLFVGNAPGSYLLQLSVQDALTGMTAFTTIAVQLIGPASLSLVSGGGQTATVHQFLGAPVIFQALASDNTTPIPGLRVQASAAGALVTANSGTTDSNGKVQLIVQAGRIAGAGTITAFIVGAPQVSATATLTATADKAASFALSAAVGNADTGATVTVQVVDQFGNLATGNSAANSAALTLTAQSSSGNANFGGSTPSKTTTVQLASGAGSATLLDTTAEPVTLTLSSGSTLLPLPFSAWQTVFYDSGLAGLGAWSANGAPAWMQETAASQIDVAAKDLSSLGIGLNPQQVVSPGSSSLSRSAAGISGAITKLSFVHSLAVSGAFDATNACEAQPAFAASMFNGPGGSEYHDGLGNVAMPLSGYPVLDACGHPSFGKTDTWTSETYDLTDALSAGYDFITLGMMNGGDPLNPPQPAAWYLDNVAVQTLVPSSFSSATTMATIFPGAATTVQFAASSFGLSGAVLYGQCTAGVAPADVTIQTFDSHGNAAYGSGTVELDWTNSTTVTLQGAVQGSISSAAPGQATLAFTLGVATARFVGPSSGATSTVTLKNPPAGLALGTPVSAGMTFASYVCHQDGFGGTWSDEVAAGTNTQAQALVACQNQTGVGNCSTSNSGSYTYPSSAIGGCRQYDVWYFATTTVVDGCNGSFGQNPGGTDYVYFTLGCGCAAGPVGTTALMSLCQNNGYCPSNWN